MEDLLEKHLSYQMQQYEIYFNDSHLSLEKILKECDARRELILKEYNERNDPSGIDIEHGSHGKLWVMKQLEPLWLEIKELKNMCNVHFVTKFLPLGISNGMSR